MRRSESTGLGVGYGVRRGGCAGLGVGYGLRRGGSDGLGDRILGEERWMCRTRCRI